jgi:hypothetical protein
VGEHEPTRGAKLRTNELTAAETTLVDCVAKGRRCQFDKASSAPVIRASVIRDILLGVPLLASDPEEPRITPMLGPGLALSGAHVEGELDLAYGASIEGGDLPPLLLEACVFTHPIVLTGARLRGLSLHGSRLTHLKADFSKIQGTLNLTGVRTSQDGEGATGAEGEGLCWIDLRGATIDGDLEAGAASLVVPPARPEGPRPHRDMRYALDMRGARISGTVNLRPRFKALGGLALRLAKSLTRNYPTAW